MQEAWHELLHSWQWKMGQEKRVGGQRWWKPYSCLSKDMRGKPPPRDPAEASYSGSAGVSADVCWVGGGKHVGDVEQTSETCVP